MTLKFIVTLQFLLKVGRISMLVPLLNYNFRFNPYMLIWYILIVLYFYNFISRSISISDDIELKKIKHSTCLLETKMD